MQRKRILFALSVLALASLACRFQINSPVTQVKTGPIQTETIIVDVSTAANQSDVTLVFGAGELILSPGEENHLLEGNATYNVSDFKPQITNSGSRVRIEQGNLNIKGIPSFNDSIKNEWNLQLGQSPVRLNIEAGAYKGDIELGGLAITEIDIADGASEVHLSFSEPNRVEMSRLEYTTGASNVTLRGLGYANLSFMNFKGGAGNYLLDFSGPLQRDAEIIIESGISNIEISIPSGTNAILTFEGGLSNIDTDGQWTQNGSTYTHAGEGPTLNIRVKMGAGNIELSTDY